METGNQADVAVLKREADRRALFVLRTLQLVEVEASTSQRLQAYFKLWRAGQVPDSAIVYLAFVGVLKDVEKGLPPALAEPSHAEFVAALRDAGAPEIAVRLAESEMPHFGPEFAKYLDMGKRWCEHHAAFGHPIASDWN